MTFVAAENPRKELVWYCEVPSSHAGVVAWLNRQGIPCERRLVTQPDGGLKPAYLIPEARRDRVHSLLGLTY